MGGGKRRKKNMSEPDDKVEQPSVGWLEHAVEKKRKENQAISKVFSSDQESRKKNLDSMHEMMKKDRETPEEKGGALYAPISNALEKHREKQKEFSKIFSSEQERRESQRKALKSWILGQDEKDDEAGENKQ